MKLESQVCSFELAQLLRDLGVKQDSLFYYQNNPYSDGTPCMDIMITEYSSNNCENVLINTECEDESEPKYSAFTATELGNLLPKNIKITRCGASEDWICYLRLSDIFYPFNDINEANARAKAVIFLYNSGIINND